jgi:arylsulfatase A-like enzyme
MYRARARWLCIVVLSLAATSTSALTHAMTDARPDILLIVADDLGYSDLGAFGGEIETPNLDALARRGLQLTNFHAGATCSPTRAMLMTGVDHHRAGLGTMAEALRFNPHQQGKPGYEGHLNDRVVTVASVLRDVGYATRMVGKWHLGREPEDLPSGRGFEHSYAMLAGGAQHFDGGRAIPIDPPSLHREDGREIEWPDGRYSSDFYTDKMIQYFEEAPAERPLFAYVAYTAPHWPLQAPDAYLKKYAGRYAAGWDAVREARLARMKQLGLIDDVESVAARPAFVPAWKDLSPEEQARAARLMEIYAAMVDNLDVNVGRLLQSYQRLDRGRETVIIFMSDNGAEAMVPESSPLPGLAKWIADNFDNRLENLGRPGSYVGYGPGWAHVSNAPFRSFKGSAYEGGTRTAAFVVLPQSGPGRMDDFVHVLDIAPTLLRLAGAAGPGSSYQGRPIHPLEGTAFLDSNGGPVKAEAGRVAAHELFGHRNVRLGPLKAVSEWSGPQGPAQWQLFDLAVDPGEQHDLSSSRGADLEGLIARYDAWATAHGVIMPSQTAPAYEAR